MSRVKYYTALLAAKSAYLAIKMLNKSSGTSFVGMMTLKICPSFLKYCKLYMKNAKTILEASNAMLLNFERPADQGTAVQNKRASYGKVYFDKYKTVEEVKARLDTFHTMDPKRLTDDEYEKLIEMVDDTYTN